jgi:virginiamycin A acetyltransferase
LKRPAEMRRKVFGLIVEKLYARLPLKEKFLSLATVLEGGQMYSRTLRAVLSAHYGVHAGNYSYGSLLTPGLADRGTIIGPYASVGPNVRRIGASHPLSALTLHPFWYNPGLGLVSDESDVTRSGCEIGPEVWIGANVVILPGCRRVGAGAVIGAGSIVTKDIPDFAIVVGNPARQVSSRLTALERSALLGRLPWNYPPDKAGEILQEIANSGK